ncbi:hypothetical protein HK096_006802, partial [Nowakowskiella sp. JEL0078]
MEGQPIWGAKNWAYKNVYKITQRYRDAYESRQAARSTETPEQLQKRKEVSEAFILQFLPEIFETYMRQIDALSNGQWISSKCKLYISKLITVGINYKDTWKLIRPRTQQIIVNFIFPTLFLTEQDMDMWEDAPIEYIMEKNSFFEQSSARSARELVNQLVQKRKATFEPIMQFVNLILAEYQNSPPELRNPLKKDAALNIITCIVDFIMKEKSSPFSSVIEEQLFVPHVLPELSSPHPYLQERACEVLRSFLLWRKIKVGGGKNTFEFKNSQILRDSFISVLTLVQHPKLPVQAEATSTVEAFLLHDEVLPLFEEHVPQTIKILLNLTSVHKLDSLSSVLATIVGKFPKIVSPFAVELGQQLSHEYIKILEEATKNEEFTTMLSDLEEAQSDAALGLLETMCTLMDAVAKPETKPLQIQYEQSIFPALEYALKNFHLDSFDHVFEIVEASANSLKTISPMAAALFPYILDNFNEENFDIIGDSIENALDDYFIYGQELIGNNSENLKKIFGILQILMERPLVTGGDLTNEDTLEKEEEIRIGCLIMEKL